MDIPNRFPDPSVQKNAAVNLAVIDALDEQIADLELYLTRTAKVDDVQTYHRLQTIPGVGKVLALVLLYEIHDIRRFATSASSYRMRGWFAANTSRPARCLAAATKIGNAHLRWAFGEAACLFLRGSERAKRWKQRQAKKRGEGKALAILAARLGGPSTTCCASSEAFDEDRFWQGSGVTPRREARHRPLPMPRRHWRWHASVLTGSSSLFRVEGRHAAIDLRQARSEIRLATVLALLGFSRAGVAAAAAWALPASTVRTPRRSRSFAAHLGKNVWHCFRCGAGGNALDLWAALTRQPLYAAVLDLYRRLGRRCPGCRPLRHSKATKPRTRRPNDDRP